VVFAAALVMLSSTGCAKLQARDHLNKGVQAYKNSKFEQAIDHFQQAVALDPTLLNAGLSGHGLCAAVYSGRRYSENNHYGEQAIDQYKQVLQKDPKNINSIKGIAYLYLQMKKFDLRRSFTKRLPRSIRTIPSRITRWRDRLDPTMCRVRKNAPNWA